MPASCGSFFLVSRVGCPAPVRAQHLPAAAAEANGNSGAGSTRFRFAARGKSGIALKLHLWVVNRLWSVKVKRYRFLLPIDPEPFPFTMEPAMRVGSNTGGVKHGRGPSPAARAEIFRCLLCRRRR